MSDAPEKTDKKEKRQKKGGGVIGRALSRVLAVLIIAALVFALFKWGPGLYKRFFGNDNIAWVSERFSEELVEKNEMVAYESTITGQETFTQDVWLFGTVQHVLIPYSFSINFVVDLSGAVVRAEDNTVDVYLPAPRAGYYKLTVDEENMKKQDFLYPLSPEQYSAMKLEIEQRLYDECAEKPEYLSAAWDSAEKNIKGLFESVLAAAPGEDEVLISVHEVSEGELEQMQKEDAQQQAA